MTDLEQLTRELAKVKSRETDPLLELDDKEGQVFGINDFFGCRTIISDEELLRKTEVDLVEASFYKMFREISAAMAVADYEIDPARVCIDIYRNERLCATELVVRALGEEPTKKLSTKDLMAVNLCYLNNVLRDKNERR